MQKSGAAIGSAAFFMVQHYPGRGISAHSPVHSSCKPLFGTGVKLPTGYAVKLATSIPASYENHTTYDQHVQPVTGCCTSFPGM